MLTISPPKIVRLVHVSAVDWQYWQISLTISFAVEVPLLSAPRNHCHAEIGSLLRLANFENKFKKIIINHENDCYVQVCNNSLKIRLFLNTFEMCIRAFFTFRSNVNVSTFINVPCGRTSVDTVPLK